MTSVTEQDIGRSNRHKTRDVTNTTTLQELGRYDRHTIPVH